VFWVQCLGSCVQGLGFWIQGLGLRVEGLALTGGDPARVSRHRALVFHKASVVFELGADAAARAGVAHCAQLPKHTRQL